MLLKTCKSKKGNLENIKEPKKAGKPQKQAADIALSKARKGSKK